MGAGATAALPTNELHACIAVHSLAQIAVGLLYSCYLVWWLERSARLAFLRQAEEGVQDEWALERRRQPSSSVLVELAALPLLAWQLVDCWMQLVAGGGGVAITLGGRLYGL